MLYKEGEEEEKLKYNSRESFILHSAHRMLLAESEFFWMESEWKKSELTNHEREKILIAMENFRLLFYCLLMVDFSVAQYSMQI